MHADRRRLIGCLEDCLRRVMVNVRRATRSRLGELKRLPNVIENGTVLLKLVVMLHTDEIFIRRTTLTTLAITLVKTGFVTLIHYLESDPYSIVWIIPLLIFLIFSIG